MIKILRLLFLLSLFFGVSIQSFANAREVIIPDKTPTDVYRLVLALEKQVVRLREQSDVFDAWPIVNVNASGKRAPRHVLQKSIEVLEKINRLRQIRNLGPITITDFPSRYITPDEVYDSVKRLVGEMDFILGERGRDSYVLLANSESNVYTPTDVYKKLWEISIAIDPLLGIRGFSPSDVFAQALYVNSQIRFLRLSQNLPDNIDMPARQESRHPNHALQAAYHLLARISSAERNLWMEPEVVPEVPRRVIRPTEVYDALQIVIAELKRIQFRLGIERSIPMPVVEPGKSPADVVQLLGWAEAAMPQFEPGKVLYQFDQRELTRKPADVLVVAQEIERGLLHYRQQRGIPGRLPRAPLTEGLAPKHVYQKTLTNLNKVARLRQQASMGHTVVPEYPLRAITPNEVYEIAVRLRDELNLVYENSGVKPSAPLATVNSLKEVTPSHVYRQMWDLSALLDSVLGETGYSVQDLYRETLRLNRELALLVDHLGREGQVVTPPVQGYVSEDQVLEQAHRVLDKVASAQRRAGLVAGQIPRPAIDGKISVSDLFNTVEVIRTELLTLKVQLGITRQITPVVAKKLDVGLLQVYQQLAFSQQLISQRLLEE